MKLRNLLTLMSLSLMISLPAITWAQSGPDKKKLAREKEDSAELMRSQSEEAKDELSAEQRPETPREARSERYEDRDISAEKRADVEEMRGRDKDLADSAHAERQSGPENAQTKGNERAQEMRARRDERKAIKEEYKSDRTPGQEADSASIPDDDVDQAVDEAKDKPKKSWWKFWGE